MKTNFLYAAAFCLMGSVAMATPVDDLVKSLTDQGATHVEVRTGATTTKVEGVVNDQKVEVTIDNVTGDVVKQETAGVDGTTGSTDDSADDSSGGTTDSGDDNGGSGEGSGESGGEHDGSGHDGSGHDGGESGGGSGGGDSNG